MAQAHTSLRDVLFSGKVAQEGLVCVRWRRSSDPLGGNNLPPASFGEDDDGSVYTPLQVDNKVLGERIYLGFSEQFKLNAKSARRIAHTGVGYPSRLLQSLDKQKACVEESMARWVRLVPARHERRVCSGASSTPVLRKRDIYQG